MAAQDATPTEIFSALDDIPLIELPHDTEPRPASDDMRRTLLERSISPKEHDAGKAAINRTRLSKLASLSQTYRTSAVQRLRRSRYHGWRMGVLGACCMSTFVLLCNIAIITTGAIKGYDSDGLANLIVGEETTISRWNTGFHVFINALSTILLAGSNYTMQILSSPTRDDIDTAHAMNQWLDIGILSPRNMRKLPRKRAWLCLFLSLSSIPLHFL
jgi:hypothetical protein